MFYIQLCKLLMGPQMMRLFKFNMSKFYDLHASSSSPFQIKEHFLEESVSSIQSIYRQSPIFFITNLEYFLVT